MKCCVRHLVAVLHCPLVQCCIVLSCNVASPSRGSVASPSRGSVASSSRAVMYYCTLLHTPRRALLHITRHCCWVCLYTTRRELLSARNETLPVVHCCTLRDTVVGYIYTLLVVNYFQHATRHYPSCIAAPYDTQRSCMTRHYSS